MYEPKVIISEEYQSSYKLMLYKEVVKLCENNEPVNPFQSFFQRRRCIKNCTKCNKRFIHEQ